MAELQPPADFPFPFEPYAIQKDFMSHLYQTLEKGKIGIFESPTGTVSSSWLGFQMVSFVFQQLHVAFILKGEVPQFDMWFSKVATRPQPKRKGAR